MKKSAHQILKTLYDLIYGTDEEILSMPIEDVKRALNENDIDIHGVSVKGLVEQLKRNAVRSGDNDFKNI